MIQILILIPLVLSLLYLSFIVFLWFGLRRLSTSTAARDLKFSVVIAAHNEEKNIEKCLMSVLSQTVGADHYEVILVDDRSSDATANNVSALAKKHGNLSVLTINATPAGLSPKKYAVSQGISAARNEIVVFTDADCVAPAAWLETIGKYFDDETGLVQGITAYSYVPGISRLFFGLQAADFLSHGIVSAAAIGAGLPLNSNANNFAFRKKAFEDSGGYGAQGSVISGDDDLLLQRIWRSGKWRIRYMADKAGKVTTLPTETLRGVFEQRKRWGSKTVHYNGKQVGLLSSVFLFYLLIAVALIAGFFKPVFFAVCGVMLAVKVIGELVLMMPGTRMFGELSLRKFIIPASLIQLPLVLCAVVLGVFGKFVWKNQKFGRTTG